jgi:hypothetical protein
MGDGLHPYAGTLDDKSNPRGRYAQEQTAERPSPYESGRETGDA